MPKCLNCQKNEVGVVQLYCSLECTSAALAKQSMTSPRYDHVTADQFDPVFNNDLGQWGGRQKKKFIPE